MTSPSHNKVRIIDVHGHINVPGARELLVQERTTGKGEHSRKGRVPPGISNPDRVAILHDPAARIADLDRTGIDVMVLSPTPQPGYYEAERDIAGKVTALQNEHVAQVVNDHPVRFAGLGIVPLQHPQDAVKELERSFRMLGHKGVFVATRIGDCELSDPRFSPFWEAAEDLGALVFLHPMGFSEPRRLEPFFMTNVVGQPLETTLALAHLIFGGVLERHPRLKVLAVHGGGFLPFYLGRFEQAFRQRKECRINISASPKHYLRQVYFDTVVFEPEAIAYLLALVGADHVLMGSDLPFDMGQDDPVALIQSVPTLSSEDTVRILGGNAADLGLV